MRPSDPRRRILRFGALAVFILVCLYGFFMAAWSCAVKVVELNTPNVTYETSGWRQVERFEPSNGWDIALVVIALAAIGLYRVLR